MAEPKKSSEIIRNHSLELLKILTYSSETLPTLAVRLYQSHLISQQTKKVLLSSPPQQAAIALSDCLELKVDQNPKHLTTILEILNEEEAMKDLVEKMELELTPCAREAVQITSTDIVTVPEPSGHVVAGDSDIGRAVAVATRLKNTFESLLTLIVTAISVASPTINLDLLKIRISWHLSLTKQNPPPIQEILVKLRKEADTPLAVLNLLVIYNLVGYLNFKLLHVFNSVGNMNKSEIELKKYEKMHFEFYETFTLRAIVEAFKRDRSLAPVSNIDLPSFKVELQEPWKGRKVYEWKDIVSNISALPQDLIITGVEEGSVILTYAVLPCFVATLVEVLTDETIVKQLAAYGVNFELSEYLLTLGRQEIEDVNSMIEHSKLVVDVLAISKPEGGHRRGSVETLGVNKLIPQPAPKPPEGGYDDVLFLDPPATKEYQCPVCHLILRDPYILSCCGALICEFCKLRSGNQCPCCRNVDHNEMLEKRTRGKILSLRVKCPKTGCSWTGELLDLQTHKCPFSIVKCQYDCGKYFFASCVSLHEEVCPRRSYELMKKTHERQIASYEEKLKFKDNAIRVLETDNAALLKRMEEEATEMRRELEKMELDYTKKLLIAREELAEAKAKMELQEEEFIHQKTGMLKNQNMPNMNEAKKIERRDIDALSMRSKRKEVKEKTGGLPGWHPGPSTITRRLIPPCVRAMPNFTNHKLSGDSWYSPPFYTGSDGYKLQLRVDADGISTAKGTHVSVCVCFMEGESDDCLGWPFKGSIHVKLLNWIEDENHLGRSFSTTLAAHPGLFNRGVKEPDEMCRKQFIVHNDLEFDSQKNTQFLMEDALCFEISSVEVLSNYQPSFLPEWCSSNFSHLTYGLLPVYRTVRDFNQLKKEDDEYYSDPFYTSKGGYKLTLNVCPNGFSSGKGTHVSVYICLMKGENDHNLPFPLSGIFTIKLLNWKQDAYHVEKSITFDETTQEKCRERVTAGERATGRGLFDFVSLSEIENSTDEEYINKDQMSFKIQFHPLPETIQQTGSPVPSWYDATSSLSTTPPCARTLYNFTAYKKTNRQWCSEPFYSSDKGYKLQLKVYANGDGLGKGTHLSLYVTLLKGEYDDQLQWPFNANITVQTLNWSGDNSHEGETIHHHKAQLEYRSRVTDGDAAPGYWGFGQFISHSLLETVISDKVNFLTDDNICFRIVNVEIIDLK